MNFLRTFMAGRYGPDHLNTALIIFALLLSFLSRFAILSLLVYPSYLLLALTVFRFLSRNIQKRRVLLAGQAEAESFRHKNEKQKDPQILPVSQLQQLTSRAARQRQAADYLP
jgi:hypothetical protein